jgi:hypothetical protein
MWRSGLWERALPKQRGDQYRAEYGVGCRELPCWWVQSCALTIHGVRMPPHKRDNKEWKEKNLSFYWKSTKMDMAWPNKVSSHIFKARYLPPFYFTSVKLVRSGINNSKTFV